jgi:GNAT superfamily N-acetyltransferase
LSLSALTINHLLLLQKNLNLAPVTNHDFKIDIKFIDPTECKKIASLNHWQDQFQVDIDKILLYSDLSVVAEINGRLAHWSHVALKSAYVAGIQKKISIHSECAYIYGIYTAGEFRKMGIASAVLERISAYLAESGIKNAFFLTNRRNLSMIRVGEKKLF